jgi:TetR/AcrR family transcriptional regulator, tetracycline repressor protein
MPERKSRNLNRDKVVEAGLDLINRQGADAVTIRALAQVLGVTPMALYNHVSSKRELLRAIAEHVIGRVDFHGGHDDWQGQIRHCFRALRGLCLQYPGLPRLLEIEGAAPPSVFAPMDVAAGALRRAGLNELESVRTFFVLLGFTLSQAGYQTRGPFPGLEPPGEWDFDASFEYGLTLIITGVAGMTSHKRW